MTSLLQMEAELSVPASIRRQIEVAARSLVPMVITRGGAHAIHYANPAFATLLGCSVDELLGLCLLAVCREAERIDALLERAYRARTTELIPDVAYVARGGAILHAATLVQPIDGLLEPAAVVQLVTSPLSQSEADRTSRDLKQANELLLLSSLREHELAERADAVALDNARLYHEAKQASRMREDVLAIVSHDLRNPLGAITMCIESLLKHVPAHDPLEFGANFAVIHRSSKHMRRLIEELLEVASIQSGQLSLTVAPVAFGALAEETLQMLGPLAAQKGVSLAREPSESLVCCDAPKVVRVLANVVGNAIKFTPGGGAVVIRSACAGEQLRVSVADSGVGIAASELPRLFEQYWKGQQTGRTGMGLGLYIARGIVEAHGGRIWVESDSTGSTFSFTLPLASA